MGNSSPLDQSLIVDEFRRAMEDCEALYRNAAQKCIQSHPELALPTPAEFHSRLLDLHRGLLAKIFVTLVQADWQLSREECRLADELIARLWGERLSPAQLRPAVQQLIETAGKLSWGALVGPFERLPPLRAQIGDLESVIVRVANLVAKADGHVCPDEVRQLEGIQHELARHLKPISLAESDRISPSSCSAAEAVSAEAAQVRSKIKLDAKSESLAAKSPAQQLKEIQEELAQLIGLASIKQEVRELAGFLQMQQERARLGMPQTRLSLHMVFSGNPGTGKTTVARLVGRLFGAMGILSKGHLVETDRSGLVAEYSGQTGPKCNKKIDEALDGVLFIDEAYSLTPESGEDPYGGEAVQSLLKRMEDDRQRLVVILAGYPRPMDRLLRSNPGLSSRFNRRLEFPDYTAIELGRILDAMCQRDHYRLPGATRAKLLAGFQHLLDHRDEHFGNGRVVRNAFESAIRRMALRIAGIAPLTKDLLSVLEPDDFAHEAISAEQWSQLTAAASNFRLACPHCEQKHLARAEHLGKRIKCKQCGQKFPLDWGEPTPVTPTDNAPQST